MEDRYYFAYGSNMNLEQMKYRCPAAEVVENVRLEDYRLAFRGKAPGNGVATVLPEKGSCVEGVLWKITEACEKSLDFYEGFPSFYGKESIQVKNQDGVEKEVFVYMFQIGDEAFPEGNFTHAQEGKAKNPSEPFSRNKNISSGRKTSWEEKNEKPSVRKELGDIRKEQEEKRKRPDRRKNARESRKKRKNMKTKGR